MSVPTIGYSADRDNHPRKWGSRDLTTLNHHNNFICSDGQRKEPQSEMQPTAPQAQAILLDK
jgi:hypothetical protein